MTAAGQRLAAELDAALSAAGFPDLRSAHAPVFMAIDPEGTRVTELARRTRMTKQAVGELIRYLAGCGYVTVAADPEDGRARRVSLTESGWRAIDTGEQVIGGFDRWLADAVGADEVAHLRQVLDRIIATDPADRREPPSTA
ncbi:MarR family transcriptional regulator [Actinoplanes bogorensis]|uniref:MarR family transcriptional regulator n=1 Tax=Paractinoplanes bogorensis TaxID=1610840 RepID=A0ABS5YLZ9_9ACTN|nr:MarR family transcriptional regulator [Actinoplanes bogorensis]MBU2663769.1 MarR family transcriptional regulator [Actinoplanes bogorensis]